MYVFNPRFGLNDAAKAAVKEHALKKNAVSEFRKELGGFTVKVHYPKQAEAMHAALCALDSELDTELDLGGMPAPETTIVSVASSALPRASCGHGR